jgi:HK97 family phage prohead protease
VVLARLAEHGRDTGAVVRGARVSQVPFRPELRDSGDGTVQVHGYATVYDVPYDIAGGPPWGFTETIARGAADKAVARGDDVRFLVNHQGLALARTRSGTLTLESDRTGLYVSATLEEANPDVSGLLSAIRRGDVDQMSFAFRAVEQTWDERFEERTITEVELFDVSAVSFPANPATVIAARSGGYPTNLARAHADAAALRHP